MKWRKRGVVWKPSGHRAWARSHATCPTPILLADGTLRVYVQCRDSHGVGRIGFVDLDPNDPTRVLRESDAPVLDIGSPGAFDDNGVFQTSVLRLPDGRLFMYYVGFELCHHIRYRLLTGLAISEDGGFTYRRYKPTPILERSPSEMDFRCGPFVLHDGSAFRMWYVAGSEWEVIEGKSMPVYDIRYAESADGMRWPETGRTVLPVSRTDEHGFGRPYVLRDETGYRMHYSIRKRNPPRYRLGYATSKDGFEWIRDDGKVGIDVSEADWDSDSVEFGAEVSVGGRTWLLYNGNDFGATGFGIAERVSE